MRYNGYDEDYGNYGRRDSRGRYMSGGRNGRMSYNAYAHRPEDMTRDMYSNRNESRYGFSHDEYVQKRSEYPMSDPESAKHRKQLLNDYMDDLYDMAKEMIKGE